MNKNLQYSSLQKPDIIETLEREGVELKRRGRDYWIKHHGEKTASCKIAHDHQTFYCFGCGAHGDVIDFISELHGLNFKDACHYLKIIPGWPAPIDPAAAKRRRLIKAFELWRWNHYIELCNRMIEIHDLRIKAEARKPLPAYLAFYLAEKLGELPFIEYCLDVLAGNDNAAKLKLLETRGN